MNDIFEKLGLILKDRKSKSPESSYVSSLYDKGLDHTCSKINEESEELIHALKNESNERIVSEAADLWFHSLVALSMKDLSSDDILEELEKRFGVSGHTEKNNRNT
ncbi:phosphoribosyl-ATP diphosphatase [Gammaproteobacteria bacterium]|jgi:phosphoribosyl-ATP pyrophosphohydrolase|nr:phosphoribosyl-ATP diphosphatase [Gammaproteobacteria bacterium]